jgi:hypothetical protein
MKIAYPEPTADVTHPIGHCQTCGEPLKFVPCLNCQDL